MAPIWSQTLTEHSFYFKYNARMSSLTPSSQLTGLALEERMVPEARAFRNALRLEDREIFDELYLAALPNIELMGKLVDYVLPLEQVLFAMVLEQQKKLHFQWALNAHKDHADRT